MAVDATQLKTPVAILAPQSDQLEDFLPLTSLRSFTDATNFVECPRKTEVSLGDDFVSRLILSERDPVARALEAMFPDL